MRTNLQRLLLAIMYTLFIVGNISFYQQQMWIMFICFVGFALFAIQYAKACKNESEEELDDEKDRIVYLSERYDEMKERNVHMKQEFENQVELKERKIQVADNEISELANKLDAALKFDDLKAILPTSIRFSADGEAVSIVPILRQVVREYHERLKEEGIVIQILEPDEVVFASGQEEAFRVLFKNIIDNAVKFTGEKGKIVITITKVGEEVIVVIRDSGEGLREEELEHIFEINYQGSNSVGGSGLGLAQAKAIVDHLGGVIYAKSSENDGMGIFVHLKAE